MTSNPFVMLSEFGQSVWYDYIDRQLLQSGALARLIDEDGLKGVTSNPTIFEKAIQGSDVYDDALRAIARKDPGCSARDYFYILAIEDIQAAADLLHPVYEKTGWRDGMVSLEVSPDLAHDTQGSVAEARRLYDRVNRPNVMIKIPATSAGIPAIEQLISDGINVNVTLLFAIDRYVEVAGAYLRGLRRRIRNGGSLERIASVASFFVSRVDTMVDRLLQQGLGPAAGGYDERARSLLGTIAVANAKVAYQKYVEIFNGPGFADLQRAGAKSQRLLWASTGTKNPAYSDVMYVESLIGPDTINTVPPATYESFRRHGQVRLTLEENADDARDRLSAVAQLGIDLPAALRSLEEEGVDAFTRSFSGLLSTIEGKIRGMHTAA